MWIPDLHIDKLLEGDLTDEELLEILLLTGQALDVIKSRLDYIRRLHYLLVTHNWSRLERDEISYRLFRAWSDVMEHFEVAKAGFEVLRERLNRRVDSLKRDPILRKLERKSWVTEHVAYLIESHERAIAVLSSALEAWGPYELLAVTKHPLLSRVGVVLRTPMKVQFMLALEGEERASKAESGARRQRELADARLRDRELARRVSSRRLTAAVERHENLRRCDHSPLLWKRTVDVLPSVNRYLRAERLWKRIVAEVVERPQVKVLGLSTYVRGTDWDPSELGAATTSAAEPIRGEPGELDPALDLAMGRLRDLLSEEDWEILFEDAAVGHERVGGMSKRALLARFLGVQGEELSFPEREPVLMKWEWMDRYYQTPAEQYSRGPGVGEVAGEVALGVGSTFVPGLGEFLDAVDVFHPDSTPTTRILAGVSLGISVLTFGLSPNYSGVRRAARAVGSVVRGGARRTVSAAKSALAKMRKAGYGKVRAQVSGRGGGRRALLQAGELRGVEPASAELLAAVRRKGRVIHIAESGSDDMRFLEHMSAPGRPAWASVSGERYEHILLRPDPRKIELLEEFLHGTQFKTGRLRVFPQDILPAEIHVKQFMIRDRSTGHPCAATDAGGDSMTPVRAELRIADAFQLDGGRVALVGALVGSFEIGAPNLLCELLCEGEPVERVVLEGPMLAGGPGKEGHHAISVKGLSIGLERLRDGGCVLVVRE
jgi:hypothetical protein